MVQAMHLYLDDSGTRNANHDPEPMRPMGMIGLRWVASS